MIVQLTGVVIEVLEHSVVVERDGLAYDVLVPKYLLEDLRGRLGNEIMLHTIQYLEGTPGTGNLVPRLVGFQDRQDRRFFARFVEVKGIGNRKALRALSEPVGRIADWIKMGDTKSLSRLPGIGKRAADLMVTELRDRLDDFGSRDLAIGAQHIQLTDAQQDAIEVMVAWGDNRNDAQRWMVRAGQGRSDIESIDEWVRASYRIKAGLEG